MKTTTKKGMLKKHFLPYFRKHKAVLALDLFCASLTTGCEIVLPMIVREITSIATTDISKLTFEHLSAECCEFEHFIISDV